MHSSYHVWDGDQRRFCTGHSLVTPIGRLTGSGFYRTIFLVLNVPFTCQEDPMWWNWKKRFLEVMVQQTAAIERMCNLQQAMLQHMQHLLMLQDVMPQKLIVADTDTHPLYHAFDEVEISTIPTCPAGAESGYVYLLIAENGWCKIGMSRNVKVRVKQLKIQFPFRTKLLHVIPTDDVVEAERKLHDVFDDCRLLRRSDLVNNHGKKNEGFFLPPISAIGTEWFRLSVHAVEWIMLIQHMIFQKGQSDGKSTTKHSATIPRPQIGEREEDDAYRFSHYGFFNWKRRRIELFDEYDVDQFWSQFISPPPSQETEPTPLQNEEVKNPTAPKISFPLARRLRRIGEEEGAEEGVKEHTSKLPRFTGVRKKDTKYQS